FAARYGQFVLLDPPKQGANLVLWAGPLLALAAGGWWLLRTLKPRPQAAGTAPQGSWPAAEETDPELRPYLEQVQREARQRSAAEQPPSAPQGDRR
ncbi:MAG: cytochrome c-type biogenesis protein CcmH, partial [Deinococcus sp.]|nr:cytochrome c-type biogenesis protein CcmH [Deinococcus sp.]